MDAHFAVSFQIQNLRHPHPRKVPGSTQKWQEGIGVALTVDQIVLTPVAGKVEIDVQGDLAGILMISAQTKNPAGGRGGSQVKMVAGAGFEPAAFRL